MKTALEKFIYFTFISAMFLLFLTACQPKEEQAVKQSYIIPDSLLKTLKLDTVKEGAYENRISLNGQVDFNQDKVANIYSMVTGKIQDIKVMLGDYIQKGQVLGVIQSSEMAQISSDLMNAQTNLQNAERVMSKMKDMYMAGLASQPDSLSAAVALQQAKAELVKVKRNLKLNGNNTEGKYFLKSPISGFLVQKSITNALNIRADNGTALFTVSDLKDVWVWANVYESNINDIKLNDSVQVNLLSTHQGKSFYGKVDKIMEILDPTTKAMKVRISIENPDYILKPQMYAKVTILNKEDKKAFYVPSEALIFEHSQYYVLVYKGNGKVQIKPVEKLNTYKNFVYIKSGVKVGEVVLSSNVLDIYSELNN